LDLNFVDDPIQQILNNQYFTYMKNMEKDQGFEYSQSRRRKPDRLIPFLILTVIFIIILGFIIVPNISTQQKYVVHFGFVSLSTIRNFTGENLKESSRINVSNISTSPLLSGLVKEEIVFYNSSSNGLILIANFQFSNSTQATNFYNKEFVNLSKIGKNSGAILELNSNYRSFIYSYVYVAIFSQFIAMGVGHSGNFAFLVFDSNVPTSNFNSIVNAEIDAMT